MSRLLVQAGWSVRKGPLVLHCNSSTATRAKEQEEKTPDNPLPDASIAFSEIPMAREQPVEHAVKLFVFTNPAQETHYNLSVLIEASRPFLSVSASFFLS